jgi:hypothetical protein
LRTTRIALALLGSIAVVGFGAASLAAEDSTAIKSMMGENFAAMQGIFVSLMTSNYAGVPEKVDVINRHAAELAAMAPTEDEDRRKKFMSYIYELQAHALDVRSIVQLLIEYDKDAENGEKLPSNHLREALAAHYGGMATTCVSCHNNFRQQVVK